jgi:hypothetical protein
VKSSNSYFPFLLPQNLHGREIPLLGPQPRYAMRQNCRTSSTNTQFNLAKLQ